MIRRSKRTRNFTTISNSILEDDRLSFKAKGLLVFLLSRPDNWTANETHLSSIGPDGTTAIRSALVELKEYGYLVSKRVRDDSSGKFVGWEQIIYDEPQELDDNDVPDGGETDTWETHSKENSPIINTEYTTNTECNNNTIEPDGSGGGDEDVIEVFDWTGEVVETIKTPRPLSDWNLLVGEVTYCVHGHKDFSMIPKDGPTGQGAIQRESKIIKDAKYTHDDVSTWWNKVWTPRWAWTKKAGSSIKRPTPSEVRAGIPAISQVDTIEEKASSLPPTLRNIYNLVENGAV